MKKIPTTLFILTCFCLSSFADSAPCWCAFESISSNGKYVAKVYQDSTQIVDSDSLSAGWTLTVYDKTSDKPVWTIDYDYSGYPDGYVTDNGKSFVYVEYWYYEQSPLVSIYTKGKKINTDALTGAYFKIDPLKLKETISHHLWLCEEGVYAVLKTGKRDYIAIKTIDHKEYQFDLSTGKKM